MKKETENIIYKALNAKFEAQRQEALATLEVYFENAAGIGEHPQILDEMAKQIEKLAAANDAIETMSDELIKHWKS